MSDRSTPSQDTPSPAPDTGRGGAIRQGPFPMFLMDIAQSDDADRLLRELDMLKDDALEAADTAIQATAPPWLTCVMPCDGRLPTATSRLLQR